MSDDREAIKEWLWGNLDGWADEWTLDRLASAISASPWLAEYTARVQAEAVRSAARDLQQEFVDQQSGTGYARVRVERLFAYADEIESSTTGKEDR